MTSDAFTDVSFLCCSYNQPTVLHRMLQSLVYHHPDVTFRALIVENSDAGDIPGFLSRHGIPFWKNDTGDTRHSPSVDQGFARIQTPWVLLCDTDIVIRRSLGGLLHMLLETNVDVAGTLQGDRGGYRLHPRISPHFCVVNLDRVRRHGIAFHDQARIDLTASNGFFGHPPVQEQDGRRHYDCGGTFYEDCVGKALRIGAIDGLERYVFHAESLSWADVADPALGEHRRRRFMEESERYRDVDISGRFRP